MIPRWGFKRRIGIVPLVLSLIVLTASPFVGIAALSGPAFAQNTGSTVRPPGSKTAVAPNVRPPATIAPGRPPSQLWWSQVRKSVKGKVSIQDKQAAVLIQSEGQLWRVLRNGRLYEWGAWLLLAVVVVLVLFYAIRGRIRIESGFSGETVERFNGLDRFAHWLTGVSFVILGLTGLNLLYGRYVLLPILGSETFSAITIAGKYAHNFLGFAFILGLVLMLVLWVRQNILDKYDIGWLLRGGGMFTKHSHPPARKFNMGQKMLFWAVIIGGGWISITGIYLLFPMFFTSLQNMQDLQLWHAGVSLVLIAVIIAHIYLGTLGMEGAFDAMGNGQVDRNWAREHHSVWMAELEGGKSAPKKAEKG